MNGNASDTLQRGISNLGLPPDVCDGMVLYTEKLYQWNSTHRFFSRSDGESLDRIVVRHVLDSLLPVHLFAKEADRFFEIGAAKAALYDLGSGPGLPGIPLALALRALRGGAAFRVHLVERTERRIDFLNFVTRALNLDSVVVEPIELRRLAPSNDVPTIVTFRALSPLTPDVLRTVGALFPSGSTLMAYQGSEPSEALARVFPNGTLFPVSSEGGAAERRIFRASLPGPKP